MSTQDETAAEQGNCTNDGGVVEGGDGGGGGGGEMEEELSLECSICLQPCVHPVELPCSHIFCFLCIKGVAMQGQSRCAICRAPIPHSTLTHPKLKDISQLYKHTKADHEWFYEARGGGWWQYDERSMQELDKAYESGVTSFQLLIAGHLYEIDFVNMLQYRSNNRNMSRRIKRDAAAAEKRGVAGIRLDQSGNIEADQSNSNGNNRGNHRGRRGGAVPTAVIPSSQNPQSGSQSAAAASPSVAGGELRTNPINNGNGVEVLSSGDEGVDSDDPDSLEEEEDDEMELGEDEEELEESEHSEEDEEVRDGARAPTRRSDRSTSSNNTQTPPPSSGTSSSAGGGASASSPGLQNGRRSSNSSGRGRKATGRRRSSNNGVNNGLNGVGSGTTQSQLVATQNGSGTSSSASTSPSPLLGTSDGGGGGILSIGIGSNIRLSPAPLSQQLNQSPTTTTSEVVSQPSASTLTTESTANANVNNVTCSASSSMTTRSAITCIVVGPGVRITVDRKEQESQQILPMQPPDEEDEIL